jgi:hypothetical protein
MRYASLPETTSVEQAEVHRSTPSPGGQCPHRTGAGRASFRLWALLTLNALDLPDDRRRARARRHRIEPRHAGGGRALVEADRREGVVLGLMWLVVLRTPVTSRLADLGLLLAWVFYAGVVLWNTLLG